MFVQIDSNDDEMDLLVEAECDYQPYEDPEYDGGTPIYPGCEEDCYINSFEIFNAVTLDKIERELTDNEIEDIRIECFRMAEEGER